MGRTANPPHHGQRMLQPRPGRGDVAALQKGTAQPRLGGGGVGMLGAEESRVEVERLLRELDRPGEVPCLEPDRGRGEQTSGRLWILLERRALQSLDDRLGGSHGSLADAEQAVDPQEFELVDDDGGMAVSEGFAVDVDHPLDRRPRSLVVAGFYLQFSQLTECRRQRFRVAAGPLECGDGRREWLDRFRGLPRPRLAPRQERGRHQCLRCRDGAGGDVAVVQLFKGRDGCSRVSQREVHIGQLFQCHGRQCRRRLLVPRIAA